MKSLNDPRQLPVESLQQRLLPAIANSHPKQSSGIALLIGEMKKVVVLADNDPVTTRSVIPNLNVRRFVETQADDMFGSVPARGQEATKRIRKLVVHQKIHEFVSTT